MSLQAIKSLARTPPKRCRVISRSWELDTKTNGHCRSPSVRDVAGTMVLSPVLPFEPVPYPCLSVRDAKGALVFSSVSPSVPVPILGYGRTWRMPFHRFFLLS